MNTIGEMKDIYVIANHVGIAGERIDRFLRTAEIAGYVLVRKNDFHGIPDAASSSPTEMNK